MPYSKFSVGWIACLHVNDGIMKCPEEEAGEHHYELKEISIKYIHHETYAKIFINYSFILVKNVKLMVCGNCPILVRKRCLAFKTSSN